MRSSKSSKKHKSMYDTFDIGNINLLSDEYELLNFNNGKGKMFHSIDNLNDITDYYESMAEQGSDNNSFTSEIEEIENNLEENLPTIQYAKEMIVAGWKNSTKLVVGSGFINCGCTCTSTALYKVCIIYQPSSIGYKTKTTNIPIQVKIIAMTA